VRWRIQQATAPNSIVVSTIIAHVHVFWDEREPWRYHGGVNGTAVNVHVLRLVMSSQAKPVDRAAEGYIVCFALVPSNAWAAGCSGWAAPTQASAGFGR
jgi:hypothetical protein